ncbi:MAG: DciA family protein [bacterium]
MPDKTSKRAFRPISTLTPLSGIMASALKDLKQADGIREKLIVKFWPQVIGSGFSRGITVKKFRKGTLYLMVAEKSWIKPFQEKTKTIARKLNVLLKEEMVKDIVITEKQKWKV